MRSSKSVEIPRFFLDANVRFPEKPIISEALSVRDVPKGLGIDFRGGPQRFILRGSKAESVFSFLRSALDGNNSLEDILAAVPESMSQVTVLGVLKLLHEKGVLIDGEATDSRAVSHGFRGESITDRVRGLSDQFWCRKLTVTRSARSANEVSQRIAGSKVIAVVCGLVGQMTVELLGRSGLPTVDSMPLDDFPSLGSTVLANMTDISTPPRASTHSSCHYTTEWSMPTSLS